MPPRALVPPPARSLVQPAALRPRRRCRPVAAAPKLLLLLLLGAGALLAAGHVLPVPLDLLAEGALAAESPLHRLACSTMQGSVQLSTAQRSTAQRSVAECRSRSQRSTAQQGTARPELSLPHSRCSAGEAERAWLPSMVCLLCRAVLSWLFF